MVVMAGGSILGHFCDLLSNKRQIARFQKVIEAGNVEAGNRAINVHSCFNFSSKSSIIVRLGSTANAAITDGS